MLTLVERLEIIRNAHPGGVHSLYQLRKLYKENGVKKRQIGTALSLTHA